jgi:hypothetical protein
MNGQRGSRRQQVWIADEPNRFGDELLAKAFELVVSPARENAGSPVAAIASPSERKVGT